jgi:hypothetical protein
MSVRTIDFLPNIFKTTSNQKFLSATLDQLVSEPDFKKINGYIGRKFAPTFKTADNYLLEPTTDRENYQLEPSVVVTDKADNIQFFSSYTDLLQQISHYGGVVDNQSRLFSNEAYSFDGQFDFDKLVNFSQYYWLPNGPDTVDVYAGQVENVKTFAVDRNLTDNAYELSSFGSSPNPDIILARGGTYQFVVNQPGYKFWIQTVPDVSGTTLTQKNISLRNVFGVVDNGSENGIVTFNVPQKNAQDHFVNMPVVRPIDNNANSFVDFATTLKFNQIDNQLVQTMVENYGSIDGISDANVLNGKYLVFIANDVADPDWTEEGVYALSGWGTDLYDEGQLITDNQRTGIWQIQISDTGNGDQLINLVWIKPIPLEQKVIIKSGLTNANKEFYKVATGDLIEVPLITAFRDTFYYVDSTDQRFFGRIRVVDQSGYNLDINDEILGKKTYTSPNGIVFTNGLKIKFDTAVVQSEYANNEYYVEGVGTGIRLVKVSSLITPELTSSSSSVAFDIYGFSDEFYDQILNGPLTPDYITINRASIDGNAWSRSNRWFHSQVIEATATYNSSIPNFDELQRGSRPIIEFNADLLIYNNGRRSRHSVDIIDFTVSDAFMKMEGTEVLFVDADHDGKDDLITYFEEANFKDGMTVIFAGDTDPIVRNQIYQVNVFPINGKQMVHLTPIIGGQISEYDTVIPTSGITVKLDPVPAGFDSTLTLNPSARKISMGNGLGLISLDGVLGASTGLILGNTFWFNGTSWVLAQKKTGLNTAPKFDIIDSNFASFSDTSIYVNSSFTGSKIFSYKVGGGTTDTILGFPLSYRNFNNVGDIQFENTYDSDTFSELVGLQTVSHKINTGFMAKISSNASIEKINIWTTKQEPTKQYQIISKLCDGKTSYFEIDILPDAYTLIPSLKVFLNNRLLSILEYQPLKVGIRNAIKINTALALNDKVDIFIYSSIQVSKLGYYEIPPNLEFNALNDNFTELTLGQFRNHLAIAANNSTDVAGQVPGASNLRDLDVKTRGGSILQHSAPTIYSSLFLIDKDLNFIDSITRAQKEYSQFKNRFLESFASVVNAGITDPSVGVDFILHQMNAIKNSSTPWYYSDMVPYDQNRSSIKYTVLDPEITEYEIDAIFNDTILSNKAVLVYINGKQLVKDIDFYFEQTRPSVVFSNALDYNDEIEIRIYHNTDGCFIPETPTKLGLYPKYIPAQYVDTTYQTPTSVIRGHDGSITIAFGDMRDALLFELEKRIYNNIKIAYSPLNFDIYKHIPGKFRTTDYSKTEYDQIVTRCFLSWISNNKIDYATNQWFSSNNPWSWTYNRFKDVLTKNYLPGSWRGIYRYFYDTDAPNERPWECLGMSVMPNWWVDTYGPAPYTGGNAVLWNDLENGIIRDGPLAGTYPQYARPGLSKVIPVTDSGELRPPSEFLITAFNSSDFAGSFSIGDEGPVESAWRKSSDYPFAVQQAIALMKPAIYFGQLANIQDYKKTGGVNQYIITDTNQRITPKDFKINGNSTILPGVTERNAGYVNWIADYLRYNGIDPVTKISSYLDNISVRLGYKAAGFTDQQYLKALAEQTSPGSINESIVIPNENFKIHLHKSSPMGRLIYSAVIIEKTVAGYTVSGYSSDHPYFTIVPSDPNSNQYAISVSGTTGVIYNDYQPVKVSIPYGYEFKNKQQVVDFLVSYGRYLVTQGFVFEEFNQELQETKNWILAAKEFLTWTQQGWTPGNIIVLSPILNKISLVYANAVVDEISNAPNGSRIIDVGFNTVRSSMFSAVRDGINFELTTLPEITIGMVDLNLVQYEHALVFDNQTIFSDIIYKPELGNRQYRIKLIGNKTSNWAGQLNPPGFVFNNSNIATWTVGKDYRKGDIVSYKSLMYAALQDIDASDIFNFGHWKQINSSTFKTGLLPNLAYNAKKFENIYDVDNQIADNSINKHSNSLIGYSERNYLTDLNLNSTSQAKFYQGYIKDKGTKDSISALSSATFNNMLGELSYYEEWAFRVGEYGALDTNKFVEVQLSDSKYLYDPISIAFTNTGIDEVTDATVINENSNTLYKRPTILDTNIFETRSAESLYENDIQSAGYVNLNDIDATIFDMRDYIELSGLVSKIYNDFKIWVAKDVDQDWNVYKVDQTSSIAIEINYSLDSRATITTAEIHSLVVGDIFAIRNFSTEVDGFYKVLRVDGLHEVFVAIPSALETVMIKTPSLSGGGTIFKLSSLRFNKITDIVKYTPALGWRPTDKVWVDNNEGDHKWKVYNKVEPWTYTSEILGFQSTPQAHYGQQVACNPSGEILAVSQPGSNYTDNIKLLIKEANGEFIETAGIFPEWESLISYQIGDIITYLGSVYVAISQTTIGAAFNLTNWQLVQNTVFGNAIALTNSTIVISGENPNANEYFVLIYSLATSGNVAITKQQRINGPSGFGKTIAISSDGIWLFVSETSTATIHIYNKDLNGHFSAVQTLSGGIDSGYGFALDTNSDGSMLVVGAPNTDNALGSNAGFAYVYSRTNLTFNEVALLPPPAIMYEGHFGYSVKLTADSIFISEPDYQETDYTRGVVYRYSLATFEPIETIRKPYSNVVERFGTGISFSTTTKSLIVSSQGAPTLNETLLDGKIFYLDGKTTTILDTVKNTGAVYVFDLLSDYSGNKYCFNQQLDDAGIKVGDNFGSSVAVANGNIFVGSPLTDTHGTDTGKVLWFSNKNQEAGWKLTRQETSKVDLDNVTKLYLYDSKSETVLVNLDYIDPAKGRILGVAEQDITYKTTFDPANYNSGTSSTVAIDTSYHWGAAQVGQVWWNLDTIRYIDYEQDTLTYRIKNWGRLFPGATVEVCEWVGSSQLPSQYAGDGTPKYANNDAYVENLSVDPTTGIIRSLYYYWVKNKTSVPTLPFRKISVKTIEELITSPSTQNIPYTTMLQSNALSVINAAQYINANRTILHIDYAITVNQNLIHNEYDLVQEGSDDEILPNKIVNKFIDSLTGADYFGNTVPDYKLTTPNRYGIAIRPRQTMFANRLMAVKNFVIYVNSVFAQVPIAEEFDISSLYQADPVPTLWDPLSLNVSVNSLIERSYLDVTQLTLGQQILVTQDSNYNNQWTIYEVQSDKSFSLVRTQTYRTTDYWSMIDWYDTTYDPTVKPTYTVDTIKDMSKLTLASGDVVKVRNNGSGQFVVYRINTDLTATLVGVQNGTIQLSDALWSHNTHQIGWDNDSFDTVKYDRNPTIELRNIVLALKNNIFINTLNGQFNKLFFVMLNYILSEQRMIDWAFKTSFISILHKLRKLEQFPNYIKDNQSFYEDYINEVKPYRTKIREYVIDYSGFDNSDLHVTDFDLPSYFDTDLNVWRSPNGEHARDEVILSTQPQYADWYYNFTHTYEIGYVQIASPGYGYHAVPKLEVVGGGGSGAVLSALVDFYTGSIAKVIVVKPGQGYTSTPTIRVLGDGIDEYGEQTFRCYPVMFNGKTRSFTTTLKFDRISYSEVGTWSPNTNYTMGDLVSYADNIYAVVQDLLSDPEFNPQDLASYSFVSSIAEYSAADRTMSLYSPTTGMPPKSLARLFTGTENESNRIDGSKFLPPITNSNGTLTYPDDPYLDTQIESFFNDLQLGQRAEDIVIDGSSNLTDIYGLGAYAEGDGVPLTDPTAVVNSGVHIPSFIDIYNSHAPAELLPGRIYDTLDIKVFTIRSLDNPTDNPIGYRISKTMGDDLSATSWEFRRISAAATTTLARDLNITDTAIYVVDVTKLPVPNPALLHPGVIYINGEKITYYAVDTHNNALRQIRRGVWGTGAPLKHGLGALVVDASVEQKIPGDAANESWLKVSAIPDPANPSLPSYPADGTGIFGAAVASALQATIQAEFLAKSPSYLPWLPGQSGIYTDPNLHNTRFDDDGFLEFNTPTHPFDIDPFDSYVAT